jgi:phenylacetate-CoA ligase
MLEPEVESRPWAEQLVLDDASYREQLAYVLERSAFYKEKLAGAAGGLEELVSLPLTDKRELRATVTAENPIGAHLCATRDELVRIYSTSGTTGAPSYVPLTAGDLENWVTGSARSYAASGVAAGQRNRLDVQRRPVRRRRGRSGRSSASGSRTSRSARGTPSA